MRHIAILTEARSSYGYLRPIARLIEADPELQYSLIVTNQHLLPDFGYSVEEIERDGLNITDRIYMTLDGYTPATMVKSLGVLLLSLGDAFVRLQPDFVLVLGDRGDSLMAALAGAHMNIPVAHIQAGERSGNIDGLTRHAITRFAHVHFASGPDAAERLRRMGEDEWRIQLVGAPQLDELVRGDVAPPEEIAERFELDLTEPLLLVVQHPVTEEYGEGVEQMRETLEAVCELRHQTVLIFPNTDAGSDDLRLLVERYHRPFMRLERNVPRRVYGGLMQAASALVGNSSSGLIEAPALNLPAINVGERQRDRARAPNVIDVPHNRSAIADAIRRALSAEFRAGLANGDSPYVSDGRVSERIVEFLKTVPIDARLLRKQIAY
ncbi:MAG: UDP-N-acetylglucosamine 2-epimerase (hydrolyzing) [Actinobacteria bacterium]|nr:UDP-N-acetylglucosamine 2-epimerase (hydrolyzing) [Actinomycetota bacterium]